MSRLLVLMLSREQCDGRLVGGGGIEVMNVCDGARMCGGATAEPWRRQLSECKSLTVAWSVGFWPTAPCSVAATAEPRR